ncbi:hydroxymethylbilane synthase [Modestobacter sp. I12A-02628]|uniref:Porphobilinogen deaminase n=1 Tax=Goekera deserti TaxID=2497753 RepID=A0A7K3W8P8_9ACTN|nr:hydroxymethylbilane synthase [Goekera deserti]MPR00497.1 hydroxymethylbilane synthase [Goekera deserti]NDI49104.1 hydroxymethylbilane synthase [Goekera deserti]NEL52842.1 hydroxymethylbilane synthase [Goekera deserti]
MTTPLRLGTRRSQLALTQSQHVADALTAATGVPVELVHITTEGDRSAGAIAQLGGTGVFVTAIRQALHDGLVDLAVHSYKDLPTAPEPGLALAAVPAREDPRDALVARDGLTLGELPAGSTVGTGAPRRMAQLRALGLGLEVVPIRGNVDTRMARVVGADELTPGVGGDLDAVVLARAGLTRLGRQGAITETLDPLQVLPAPAQGALAIECRADDARTTDLLAVLDDAATRACVVAERTVLSVLEAGCSAPVAAYAELAEGEDGDELFLRASVTALDGSDGVRASTSGPAGDAVRLGRELAEELLDRGAGALMATGR